jgi:uncharacterized protein (TIGR03084 family)
MGERPTVGEVLDDLRDEQDDLHRLVDDVGDLSVPTPAAGWDVRDTVSHLSAFDEEATKAATTPQLFLAGLSSIAEDVDAFMDGLLEARRALPRDRLLEDWRSAGRTLVAALAELDPSTRLPWYGPPMNPVSFATARLMEYWAHGQDVADAVGVRRVPTARLRHICHLGVRTRGFSYAVRGRTPPDVDVRVELEAPDGSTWSWGAADAPDGVTGPAEDFCLLVTQRRHRADLSLVATGTAADEWLDIAQCFAGPPGAGRPPQAAP